MFDWHEKNGKWGRNKKRPMWFSISLGWNEKGQCDLQFFFHPRSLPNTYYEKKKNLFFHIFRPLNIFHSLSFSTYQTKENFHYSSSIFKRTKKAFSTVKRIGCDSYQLSWLLLMLWNKQVNMYINVPRDCTLRMTKKQWNTQEFVVVRNRACYIIGELIIVKWKGYSTV